MQWTNVDAWSSPGTDPGDHVQRGPSLLPRRASCNACELETALGKLLTRLPDLRLTNIHDLQWHPRNTLRGVRSLIATRELSESEP